MTFAGGILRKKMFSARSKMRKPKASKKAQSAREQEQSRSAGKAASELLRRKLPDTLGGFTIGVLVQTNFGGVLSIDGAPVGVELGKYYLKDAVSKNVENKNDLNDSADGSIIIVIATDAPVDARQLKRIAARSMSGLARTGSAMTNGSGDYAIAFSTAPDVRIKSGENMRTTKLLIKRCDVAAFSRGHRSDRRSDLQFAVSRNDDERKTKPHGRGFAA